MTLEKQIFDYWLSRARGIVLKAFCVLTARWHVFHTKLAVGPQLAKDIVKATDILHNVLQIQTTPAEMTALVQEVEGVNVETLQDLQGVGGKSSLEPMRVRITSITLIPSPGKRAMYNKADLLNDMSTAYLSEMLTVSSLTKVTESSKLVSMGSL